MLLHVALVIALLSSFDAHNSQIAGAILVFEYLYFLLQANKVNGDLQANLEQAVRTYQTSGVQATVAKLITAAFQCHGEDVEVL
ncbi:hypothetical protein BKA82DRAFT_4155733, partial [Pisolithus tinctorius]